MDSNIRVIFSIRLHTQQASTFMIDALSRLIIDVSVFTPTGLVLRAIDPLKYYNRWRDEKS